MYDYDGLIRWNLGPIIEVNENISNDKKIKVKRILERILNRSLISSIMVDSNKLNFIIKIENGILYIKLRKE